MTEGRAEEAASACFGRVTSRLQRLFRRLPKSHLGPVKLQAQLARGRSQPLRLGAFEGAQGGLGSEARPRGLFHGEGSAGTSGSLVFNAELSITPCPTLTPQD